MSGMGTVERLSYILMCGQTSSSPQSRDGSGSCGVLQAMIGSFLTTLLALSRTFSSLLFDKMPASVVSADREGVELFLNPLWTKPGEAGG